MIGKARMISRRQSRSASILLFLLLLMWSTAGSCTQEAVQDLGPILKPVRYELDVRVDFAEATIKAACRVTVKNPYDRFVDRVSFVLYRLLKVQSIKDAQGRKLTFLQEVKPYQDEEKFRANIVQVTLPEPLAPQATVTLAMDYAGTLMGYVDAGMTYVKDRVDKNFTIIRMDCLAYPQPGVASWQENTAAGLPSYDYALRVTVPKGWTVANGGILVNKTRQEGQETFAYRNTKPAWRLDAAIARYKILSDRARPIRVYYFPSDKQGAGTVFQGLVKILDLFSARLGRLEDFRGFAVIEVPQGFGSQADVTSILLTRDVFMDKSRLTDLYHEVSHLWSVPSRDPLPCRLESEGVAMYLQFWAQEQLDNRAGARDAGASRLRERFLKACQKNPKAAETPMIDYGKADLTDLSYNKGMIFFYLLDRLAGQDKLLSALADCWKRFGASGATTREFMACLESGLGAQIDPVIQDWVYGVRSSELLKSSQTLYQIADLYRKH
jgi:hypothetical protein